MLPAIAMRRAVTTLARAPMRAAQLTGTRRTISVQRAVGNEATVTSLSPEDDLAAVTLRDGAGLRSQGGLRTMMRQRREARQTAAEQAMPDASPAMPGQREWRDSRRLAALKQEIAGGVHRVSRARIAEGRLADFLYWAEWKLGEAYPNEGFRCAYLVVDRNTNTVENHTFWTSSDALSRNEHHPTYSARMKELASFLTADAPELQMEPAEGEEWNTLPMVRVKGLEAQAEQQALLRLQRVAMTVPNPDKPAQFLPLVARCSDIGPRTLAPGSGVTPTAPLGPVRVLYRPMVRLDPSDGDAALVQVAPEVWQSVEQRGPLSAPRKRRDGSEGKVTVEAVKQEEGDKSTE